MRNIHSLIKRENFPLVYLSKNSTLSKRIHREAVSIKKELRNIYGGSLHVDFQGDHAFFTEYHDYQRTRISSDKDRVYKLAIIEHFGLTNKTEYLTDALERIRLYDTGGIHPGASLFCSFESNTQSSQSACDFIKNIIYQSTGFSF